MDGTIHHSAPSHAYLHSHFQLSEVALSPLSTQLAPPPLAETDGFGFVDDGGSGNGRWLRQETMALLEVRTNLDSNPSQKSALWDQVSRIMAEEYGYWRGGKKCKEKLDNLYKFYKKTKEGMSGRQDGKHKHYRFFKQLEALYGDYNINTIYTATDQQQPLQEDHKWLFSSLVSFSDSTESNTSSSDDGGQTLKWKMSQLVEVQMRRIISLQEAWLDKMLCSVDNMDRIRARKEDIWRNQETARCDREERIWASERASIVARDTALVKALERISSYKSGSTFPAIEECNKKLNMSLNDKLNEGHGEETPQRSNGYFSLMMVEH